MQGSPPVRFSLAIKQDSSNSPEKSDVDGYLQRDDIASPRTVNGIYDGAWSNPRGFSASSSTPSGSHGVYSFSEEPVSSQPPDGETSYTRSEGTSTSAAYNYSPPLHTVKMAQRRFKPGNLYGENDPSRYNNDTAGTVSKASRPLLLRPYKPSSAARMSLISQVDGHIYAPALSPANYHDYSSKPLNSYGSRVLRLLPLRLQLFWRKKRKKSLSAGTHTNPKPLIPTRHVTKLRLSLLVCVGIFAIIYLLRAFKYAAPVSGQGPGGEIKVLANGPTKAVVPMWEWWRAPERAVPSKLTKVKQKSASFAELHHTFEELMALSSKDTISARPAIDSSGDIPSVTVIVDCATALDPFDTLGRASMNALLYAVFAEPVNLVSIRLLVPADTYAGSNPGLYGYETGKVKVYTVSGRITGYFSTSIMSAISSDYVHLLRCRRARDTASIQSAGTSAYISTLIQVAGTEEYGTMALSTAGIAFSRSVHTVPMVYGPYARADEIEHYSLQYRQLVESRPIDVPYADLLVPSSFLSSIDLKFKSQEESARNSGSYDLIALVAELLKSQLRMRVWAIPLASPLAHVHPPLANLLEYSKDLPAVYTVRNAIELYDETPGGPARVAVLVSSADYPYSASWRAIICSFVKETIYGHEIRLFVSSDVRDSQVYSADCPEAQVHPLVSESIQAWSPDICLTTSESLVEVTAMDLPYMQITLPGTELGHLDWLAALPRESMLNWHVPKVELAIITHNRPASLHRLLTSIRAARYLGDRVNLLINLEQTSDGETRNLLEGSQWPYGNIFMRNRVIMGGLMTSVVESWYPADNDTYGVLLEDDVEVSPLFYSWLKFTILYYRYGSESMRKKSERLYGISLYQPKNIELRPEGRRKFDAHKLLDEVGLPSTLPYLSQIPCSWGAAYFPEHWKEFHQFLTIRLSESTMDLSDPIVPNIRSNRWPNSWKRYLIELVYLRGYSMLYPNYADFRSLSTNHLEQGVHVKDEAQAQKRRDLFEVPLLGEQDSLVDELPGGKLPSWPTLPVFDLWGGMGNEAEICQRGRITAEELELCSIASGQVTRVTGEGGGNEIDEVQGEVDHDASRLLCTGPVDEQNWREWGQRVRLGAIDIDENMLLDREARLSERERRIEEKEKRLTAAKDVQ